MTQSEGSDTCYTIENRDDLTYDHNADYKFIDTPLSDTTLKKQEHEEFLSRNSVAVCSSFLLPS